MTGGKAPEDLGRALRAVFALKQEGKIAEAGAVLSWLSGSANVAASARKRAGVKGEIGSRDALDYLQGILEVVKAAGYQGLVIIIDEAETILRMRGDVRGKSLNGIRQIIDAADRFHGLLWLFTGTAEFYDSRRGVAGLQPLHERIQFLSQGGMVNVRQSQLELRPFDGERLRQVALKLRALYPSAAPGRLEERVTPGYIEALVAEVAKGFRGDVGVVPRQLLRRLVNTLDLVEQDGEYRPVVEGAAEALTEEERRKRAGEPPYDAEPDDDRGYSPALVEI